MSKELSKSELIKENTELKKQLKSLNQELELLRKSFLPDETYYKDRFYRINENVNDVVYRFNLKNRRYEYISPQIENLFGYKPEDFYNSYLIVRKIIHPESFNIYKNHWKAILSGKDPEYFELKTIRKDGKICWIMQKNLVIRDAKNQIDAVEGIVTEITDRKIAEERLIESEAQKKAIFNNFPHLAWLKNCEGIYLSVNEEFANRAGKSIEALIGKTDKDIYSKSDAERYRLEDKEVIRNGKKFSVKEQTAETYWETFKAPVFNNQNEIIGVTGISLNITERMKTEEEIKSYSEKLAVQNVKLKLVNEELTIAKDKAEESDRLKSAFLANMSHEIRTPMNAILGFATLLRDRKLTETKQIEFINLINANCRQLLHIISDIIDISKIEANQITLFNKDFNINKTLRILKQNFENQLSTAKRELKITLKNDLSDNRAHIITDKVRLEQVLSNLLSNAVKFTEEGSIEFGYNVDKSKDNIIFFVQDTGIGMSASQQEIVFERFRQVSGAYNKQYGGTGLGLSISKGLTELLGGKIYVESEPDKGSIFFVALPYRPGKEAVPEPIPYNKVYNWEGKTILIAEDEQANYSLLMNIIIPTRAEILWVQNGIDAIDVCKTNEDIDLVLMDIKMPDMNGLEATKKIKSFRKDLPIVAQTAFAMPQDADHCLKAGCDDYLAKPLGIDDILSKINKHLKNRTVRTNLKKSKTKKSITE